jgi:hypothetical protein
VRAGWRQRLSGGTNYGNDELCAALLGPVNNGQWLPRYGAMAVSIGGEATGDFLRFPVEDKSSLGEAIA